MLSSGALLASTSRLMSPVVDVAAAGALPKRAMVDGCGRLYVGGGGVFGYRWVGVVELRASN